MTERIVKVTLSAQVADFKKGMLEAAVATRTVGSEGEKLQQMRDGLNTVGASAVAFGAALTAASGLAVKAAIGWESAWAGVTKTVDGTPEQLARVQEGLRGLTSVLPASHDEIAAVAEAAGQLGIQTDNVVAFTRTMIDLGETTNLSANDAATALARFTNIMGTSQDEVSNLGSALVGLGNNYATTESEILELSMRLAGAGRQIGMSEGDVLGLATALSSVGIEAEAGGSAMSKVMIDIAASVEQGGDRLDKFAAAAGMSAEAFANQWRTAPSQALASFVKGLANAESQGTSTLGVLSELGITEVRMRDALLRSASAADQFAGAMSMGNQAFAENNALTIEAAKRYETVESRIAIAGNAVRDAAIDFGGVFLPAVGLAADVVKNLAGVLGDLPEPVQGLMGVLTGAVGGVGLLGGTALLAVPKIAEFKNALATLGLSMKGIGLAGGGAMLALTALVTVVGAVASAHEEARQRAESYTSALTAGTRATREQIAANLQAERSFLWMSEGSALDAAENLGLSAETVVDALMGIPDAVDEVNAAVQSAKAEGLKPLHEANMEAHDSAVILEGAMRDQSAAIDEAGRLNKQAADAAGSNADETMNLADAAEVATAQLDDMAQALDDVGATAMTAGEAVDRAQSAINSMGDAAEVEAVTLEGTNDASIKLRDSIRDVEQSHREAAQAIIDNGGTFDQARDQWNQGREAIIGQLEAMGLSRDEAVAWADTNLGAAKKVERGLADVATAVKGIPTNPTINLQLMGASEAYSYLMGIQSTLRTITGDHTIRVATGQGGQGGLVAGHRDGGPVFGPGGPRDDKILRRLSNGEHVLTAEEVEAAGGHGAIMQWRSALLTGARTADSPGIVIVADRPTDTSTRDWFDTARTAGGR